jgi:hypothetical protein
LIKWQATQNQTPRAPVNSAGPPTYTKKLAAEIYRRLAAGIAAFRGAFIGSIHRWSA